MHEGPADDDQPLTQDELRTGVVLFSAFAWVIILLHVSLLAGLVYGGFVAWPWYVVVPLGAGLSFALRVQKRFFWNIVDKCRADLGEAETERPRRRARRNRITSGPVAYALAALIMFAVSGFWYAIGCVIAVFWPA